MMGRTTDNKNMLRALKNKDDEFYTHYDTVKGGIDKHFDEFRGLTVYCNCDNPYESQFVRYFIDNFNEMGIKRLIQTCFAPKYKQVTLDGTEARNKGNGATQWHQEITSVIDSSQSIVDVLSWDGNSITELVEDGDFRSQECLKLLNECDVVVTNPPFSLSLSLMRLLLTKHKPFIIISNINTLKGVGVYDQLKSGILCVEGHQEKYIHSSGDEVKLGQAYFLSSFGTHLYHEPIVLTESYEQNKDQYPTPINYRNCINISQSRKIPYDYDGLMLVPVSFFYFYNPSQFEIVGNKHIDDAQIRDGANRVNLFARFMIRRRQ